MWVRRNWKKGLPLYDFARSLFWKTPECAMPVAMVVSNMPSGGQEEPPASWCQHWECTLCTYNQLFLLATIFLEWLLGVKEKSKWDLEVTSGGVRRMTIHYYSTNLSWAALKTQIGGKVWHKCFGFVKKMGLLQGSNSQHYKRHRHRNDSVAGCPTFVTLIA